MRILTWCTRSYWDFAHALIRSIRRAGNDYHITVLGLNYTPKDIIETVEDVGRIPEVEIRPLRVSEEDDHGKHEKRCVDAKLSKTGTFRNFRPRAFLNFLNEGDDSVLTFGANGIVWCDLGFIDELLVENDMCFMEREKNNMWGKGPTMIRGIKQLRKLCEDYHLNPKRVVDSSTGKVVLLGTHGLANNDRVKEALEAWAEIVENGDIKKPYSDMDGFVRVMLDRPLVTCVTDVDLPREENRFCNTHLTGNHIWFAKGPTKWKNTTYIRAMKEALSWEGTSHTRQR